MSRLKKLSFDSDVLDVLKRMTWYDDGQKGVIVDKLDRDLYLRVNKALSAAGGEWNRSVGGHIFKEDPRPMIEGLLESGVMLIEKDGFFETPKAVLEKMLEFAPLPDNLGEATFLEPSAGLGAIIKFLIEKGVNPERILAFEKNLSRVDEVHKLKCWITCADFLTITAAPKVDRVYMNPPFEDGQDLAHVRKAFDLLKPGGILVSVMSGSILFNNTKKYEDFRQWDASNDAATKFIHLPEKSFHESGTDVTTVLYVAQKDN